MRRRSDGTGPPAFANASCYDPIQCIADKGLDARFATAAPHRARTDAGGCGRSARAADTGTRFRRRVRSERAAGRRRDGEDLGRPAAGRPHRRRPARTASTSSSTCCRASTRSRSTRPAIGSARRAAIVEVGKDTQVDFVIGLSVNEALTVTAATPIVDVRSTEVSFNFNADTLNSLPLERTYRGLFQLIPGVADNRSPVGPAAGGSRQDNTYLIDGANITNPGFGYLSTEVNELDIAEVNLKRAGISAEFGRTGGTVTNAVSRSGSNRFSGIGRIDWLSRASGRRVQAARRPARRRRQARRVPRPAADDGDWAGGRARRPDRAGPRLLLRLGALLSRNEVGSRQQGRRRRCPTRSGPGPSSSASSPPLRRTSHQLTVSYRHRPNHVDNAGIDSDFAPSVATTTDNGSRIATAEWANFMAARRSLNVRYLLHEREQRGRAGHGSRLPAAVRSRAIWRRWASTPIPTQANLTVGGNQYTNIQNYRRHEVARHVQPVLRHRQNQPRAEGGRRLRVRRGDAQPRSPTAGARSSTSRRTACRRCAPATSRRSRRSSVRGAPTRCSSRTT